MRRVIDFEFEYSSKWEKFFLHSVCAYFILKTSIDTKVLPHIPK